MKPIIIKFGLLALALLALLKVSEFTLFTRGLSTEIWVVLFAAVFLGFGYFVSRMTRQKEQPLKSPVEPNDVDEDKIKSLGISKREYEVLEQISNGLSNQEIAKKLFISESTVKSHVSNLLIKLDSKRRTQAIKKAKELKILN